MTTKSKVPSRPGALKSKHWTEKQKQIWEEARKKMRNYIIWGTILGNLKLFDEDNCKLVEENCHGGGILCGHTDKCCIYCPDPEMCDYMPCGCIMARDACYNLWFCEEEVTKRPRTQPWKV